MEEKTKEPRVRKPRQPRAERQQKLYEEQVINIGRVTKVTKGGRHFRFSATVVVGDRKGKVGLGTGKANEVPDAIKKAVSAATKNVTRVSLIDERTIPHEAIGVRGASKVMLKPAAEGTGVARIWYVFTKNSTAPGSSQQDTTGYESITANDGSTWNLSKMSIKFSLF